uniref:ARID domain-containing protein n=1 Tax=Cyclopterus lumpus TaxID=8103 RepID=A0A8C3A573_CYCLU
MAQTEIQQERTKKSEEQMSEEKFLIDLYRFMKKRDTPIERIPNLGFKQSTCYIVTVQQLWKQVYNSLGGNPRSTSAATCTRRHYEKLLLSYECHLTGKLVNVFPRNQPKHFNYVNYSKEHEDGQRPQKRKLPMMPLIPVGSPEIRNIVFPPSPLYAHYFHPGHSVLPPNVPTSSSVLTPHCPPPPEPWFLFPPSHLHPTDGAKEPLENLRNLAERYKTGLTEPLNLSTKSSRQESNGIPASSFTPPSSSRSPKFLNKPSPLYTPHLVVRDDGCETQDGEAGSGDASYSHPVKANEAYVIDVDAIPASSSPSCASTLRTDEGATTMQRKPGSPRTDLSVRAREEREGSPDVREVSFSHLLPSLSRDNEGQMEIEVPLSVFNNWLRQCGSSAAMFGAKQLGTLPPQDVEHRHPCEPDFLPTNLTFHTNPRHQSSAFSEDLRMLTRNHLPSPLPASHAAVNRLDDGHNHFTNYKPLPSSGILKNAVSQDTYPFDNNNCKPLHFWDVYDRETQASRIPVNIDSSPRRVQQDIAVSAPYDEDTGSRGKEGSDSGPSAVLMLNSSSSSLLHLTTEEVMKLKKIISSSS